MKCNICGSENLEGAAFCEDCGARLPIGGGVPSAPPPPAPAAPPPPLPPQPVSAMPVVPAAPAASGNVPCPGCGAMNPANEAYCEDCGASLQAGGAAPPPAAAPAPAPPVASAPPAVTTHLRIPSSNKSFPLDKDIITLGRRSPADSIYPDIDLTDDDPESYVSRRHGQVSKKTEGFFFEDTGSSNGSFVNGTRVNKGVETLLKDGDQVRLGKTEMLFHA